MIFIMNNIKLSAISKALIFLAAILIIISLFVPVWIIYLDAPQYPEGLSLQIWSNKLAGDVDIINGLNHYIGMKTLHTDDFFEFKILPYILVAFAAFFAITALVGKRKLLYTSLISFILFGIVAMVDFWKWEYDYGHNLDPNAAIKVPGMTYQPPLFGFKQLLNFSAFSVPDIGGWLIVVAGLLLVVAVFVEIRILKKAKTKISLAVASIGLLMLTSCSSDGPVAINYNKDACDFCKMSISESRFASQFKTKKGRVYKFDDMSCMLEFLNSDNKQEVKSLYVGNYLNGQEWIDASVAWYVQHDDLRSPMGGNAAAFNSKEAAQEYADKNSVKVIDWTVLKGTNSGHEKAD